MRRVRGNGWIAAAGLAVLAPIAAADTSRDAANPSASRPAPFLDAQAAASPSGATTDASRIRQQAPGRADPSTSAAAPNPLAPFLERWLSARERGARPENAPSPLTSDASGRLRPAPLNSPVSRSMPTAPAASAQQDNPYVAAMSLSERAAPDPNPVPAMTPSGLSDSGRRAPAEETRVVAPTLTAPEAPERSVDPTYRPPPSRDAKYFPQQKRF